MASKTIKISEENYRWLLGIAADMQKKQGKVVSFDETLEEFKKNPRSSNSISFNGQLLEDVIGAKTGQSQCCDVCGDEECRTVEAQEKSYEIIPAEMIIEAGLKVAHDL